MSRPSALVSSALGDVATASQVSPQLCPVVVSAVAGDARAEAENPHQKGESRIT